MTTLAEIIVYASQVMLIILMVAFFVVGDRMMSGGKEEGYWEGLAVKTIYVIEGKNENKRTGEARGAKDLLHSVVSSSPKSPAQPSTIEKAPSRRAYYRAPEGTWRRCVFPPMPQTHRPTGPTRSGYIRVRRKINYLKT